MEPNHYTELKVLMERVTVSLENMEKNVKEIKSDMVPNGTERVINLEKEVKTLSRFRNGLAAIGVFLVALLPFMDKITTVAERIK